MSLTSLNPDDKIVSKLPNFSHGSSHVTSPSASYFTSDYLLLIKLKRSLYPPVALRKFRQAFHKLTTSLIAPFHLSSTPRPKAELFVCYAFIIKSNSVYVGRIEYVCEENCTNLFKKKVQCTLVQVLRLCTGRTAHRGSRGIALLYRH
jgi:hypothetical protein